MRVLLIGEFSNLHNNLKFGLEALGVEVDTVNLGDGFKKFKSDIKLHIINPDKKYDFIRKCYNNYLYQKFIQYDVIQFINEAELDVSLGFHKNLSRKLTQDAKLSVLLLAGCNCEYGKNVEARMKIGACSECLKYDIKNKNGCRWRNNRKLMELSYDIQRHVDVMVPMAYEYYVCGQYGKFAYKMSNPIPMPIVIDREGSKSKKARTNRLLVFHPLNREGFKGTRMIKRAFEVLSTMFPDVDFLIDGKMPYEEYMQLVKRVDVLVDQKNAYTFGIASLGAMNQGKVLVTGNYRKEINDPQFKYLHEAPAFELGTSVEEIIQNLSEVIGMREQYARIGQQGIDFVSKYHDAKKVARKFLTLYENELSKKYKSRIL